MAEEEEDLNAFDLWDSVGAAIMLGAVPAAMFYVFDDHELLPVAMCMGAAVLAGAVVYALGLVFPGRIVGRIVNLVGCVLTPVYIIIAIFMWSDAVKEDIPSSQEQPVQKQ